MTDADAILKSSSKKEKDDLARWALARKAAKKEQNRRARATRKIDGQVRIEKWVSRAQVDEVRHLLSLYADARQRGEALWVRVAPALDEHESGLVVESPICRPGQRRMNPAALNGMPVLHREASPRDLFFTPGYTPALRKLIAGIVTTEGPLPRDVLELRVARLHGYSSTGTRIRERIGACLDGVELHVEPQTNGRERTFAWAGNTCGPRAPWRGRRERDLADISRHEWADLLDRHADELENADDPVKAAAALAGVKSLVEPTRELLTAYRNWWLTNPVAVDCKKDY